MISPEDLIVMKLYRARDSRSAMQFRDVHALSRSADLDRVYLDRKLAERGLTDVFKEASDERYAS